MQQATTKPPPRIPYIDGLRAIAVLGVAIYHAGKLTPMNRWFFEGRHGVDLFFVISGFCLSYPIIHRHIAGKLANFDIAKFFTKRIIRIVPPYYAAVLIFILMTMALLAAHLPLPPMSHATDPVDLLKQFAFLDWTFNFSNGSFWTLAVEMRWYLLFPLVLWLWLRARKAFWLVALASFLAYHLTRLGIAGSGIDFAVLPAFMSGIVAAELRCCHDQRAKWLSVLLLAIGSAGAFLFTHRVLQDSLDWQLIALGFVLAAGSYRWLESLLSWRPLTFIGVASYSIYLFHEPVIGVLEYDFHYAWPVALCVSLMIGVLAWYALERTLLSYAKTRRWADTLLPQIAKALTFFEISRALYGPCYHERAQMVTEPTLTSAFSELVARHMHIRKRYVEHRTEADLAYAHEDDR
jgi:peptidoglycan/LPS O-acetylase OafA/YrhL